MPKSNKPKVCEWKEEIIDGIVHHVTQCDKAFMKFKNYDDYVWCPWCGRKIVRVKK